MASSESVLVMAGTREAHGLVAGLKARGRRVIASLPEPERVFRPLSVPTRRGRFDVPSELLNWLEEEGVATIIDASHAFEDGISGMVQQISVQMGIRYMRVLRPVWKPTDYDRWHHVETIQQAAETAPAGSRLFCNTGWLSAPAFAGFHGDRVFLRQTQGPVRASPFAFMQFVYGEPPFLQHQEERLFSDLGITHLVARNTGGAASVSKLLAARQLGLPVYMVARPEADPDCPVVESVAEALAWEAAG